MNMRFKRLDRPPKVLRSELNSFRHRWQHPEESHWQVRLTKVCRNPVILVSSMVEDESKTMKLFHKLAHPGHHHKDAPEKEEVRKEDASLTEQTDHIHAHAPHPVVESYVPGPLALQMCRVSWQHGMASAYHLHVQRWHTAFVDP